MVKKGLDFCVKKRKNRADRKSFRAFLARPVRSSHLFSVTLWDIYALGLSSSIALETTIPKAKKEHMDPKISSLVKSSRMRS